MISLWIAGPVFCLMISDAGPGSPPARTVQEYAKQEEQLRKTREALAEKITIEPTEMPLGKLLEGLGNKFAEGKKIALRIDGEAFGKDAAKVVEAPIRLPKLAGVSLSTVVRLAVGQVP